MGVERSRPVPDDEHVGLGEQPRDGDRPRVEHRRALADPGVGVLGRDLRQPRRVDAQHVGAEQRERARRDRPGDHAGQVEHPGPLGRRASGPFAAPHADQGFARHGPSRRTVGPFRTRPDGHRDPTRGGDRVLHLARGPGADALADVLTPQDPHQPLPVVGVVRVRTHPPVGGAEEPRHRREPAAGELVGPERRPDPGRVHHRRARPPPLRRGEPGRRHRPHRQRVDRERPAEPGRGATERHRAGLDAHLRAEIRRRPVPGDHLRSALVSGCPCYDTG